MTINERIKHFRKDVLGINQRQLATALGLTQSGVSYMEQPGSNVSDSSIKAICTMYNLNESWLRDGVEPMYTRPPTFSLDQFVKDHGATGLELEILKAYFELDPEIRRTVLEHFKARFSAAPPLPAASEPTTEELEAEYKKSRLNSARNTGLSASSITEDTGSASRASNE